MGLTFLIWDSQFEERMKLRRPGGRMYCFGCKQCYSFCVVFSLEILQNKLWDITVTPLKSNFFCLLQICNHVAENIRRNRSHQGSPLEIRTKNCKWDPNATRAIKPHFPILPLSHCLRRFHTILLFSLSNINFFFHIFTLIWWLHSLHH